MLRLPLTATLLATVLFAADGLALTPLIIVAVVVSYVLTAWLPQTPADLRGGRAAGSVTATAARRGQPATPTVPDR